MEQGSQGQHQQLMINIVKPVKQNLEVTVNENTNILHRAGMNVSMKKDSESRNMKFIPQDADHLLAVKNQARLEFCKKIQK